MTDFAVARLPDPSWGNPRVARVIGRHDDPWGVLAVLRGTPWEELFPLIPVGVFDQAQRGHATPLMKILGPPPLALAKRLPDAYRLCRVRHGCVNAAPHCVPGEKMPECWEAEELKTPEAVTVATKVAWFWKDEIPVIILIPEET